VSLGVRRNTSLRKRVSWLSFILVQESGCPGFPRKWVSWLSCSRKEKWVSWHSGVLAFFFHAVVFRPRQKVGRLFFHEAAGRDSGRFAFTYIKCERPRVAPSGLEIQSWRSDQSHILGEPGKNKENGHLRVCGSMLAEKRGGSRCRSSGYSQIKGDPQACGPFLFSDQGGPASLRAPPFFRKCVPASLRAGANWKNHGETHLRPNGFSLREATTRAPTPNPGPACPAGKPGHPPLP